MIGYEDYDDRSLADIVFDEVPYMKDAFEEYSRDKYEVNDDEEYYRFYRREPRYDF